METLLQKVRCLLKTYIYQAVRTLDFTNSDELKSGDRNC